MREAPNPLGDIEDPHESKMILESVNGAKMPLSIIDLLIVDLFCVPDALDPDFSLPLRCIMRK